ncbi:hypothetical protein MMC14_009559 [Varicellaria rhodocarpa]|nr:hypothetical protein [Varicellaria rhodocarpa]
MSAVGILIYNFWFWWFGLDFFESSSCGTYVFFWTKVNLYAGFRSAQKVLSITTLCFHTFLTIGHVAQLQNHWRTRHIRSSEYFSQLTKSLLQESTAKALEQECQDSSSRQEAVTTKAEYIDSACSPILEYTPEDIPTSPLNQSQTSTTCVEESLPSVVEADNADTTSQQQLASKPLILDLTYSTPITPSSPLLLFERLHTAEIYLDAILSSSHMPPILKISIPHTPVRIAIPSPYSLFPACSIPRSIQSLRLHILISTLIHIYNLRQHPTTRFPYFLCLSFSSPRYTTLDPESLDAYLLLRTTSLPSQNRKSYTIPTAAFTLLVTVGIILSIELGLRWNAVQGVQSIGAVGQLVPMILGVGGLVKVAWAWWVERRRGEGEDNGEEEEPWIVEAEKCAEVYYSLRNGVVGGQETV